MAILKCLIVFLALVSCRTNGPGTENVPQKHFFPRNRNPQNSLRGSFPHGCVPGAPLLSEGVLTPLALAPDSRRITITLKRWKRLQRGFLACLKSHGWLTQSQNDDPGLQPTQPSHRVIPFRWPGSILSASRHHSSRHGFLGLAPFHLVPMY